MRYATLILAVLFAQVTSAAATEVLLKARDQTTPNWAEALSKQFKGTIEKQVPGLNATILQIPANDVENLLKEARDNPGILAIETGGDYRQLFQITPTANFSDIQMSQTQKDDVSRLRERKTSASVYVTQLRPAGMSFELLRGALSIADGFSAEKGMKLNLAPSVTVDALQTGIKQRGPSSFVWYGKIENREVASGIGGGSATFVVQDETITGMVAIGSDVYIVNPLGNGLHAIVKTNPDGHPPDHPPGAEPLRHDTPKLRLQKKGAVENQAVPEIQALVLFTPAVRTALGPRSSPDLWATLAVEAANLVSKNSHARVSLKLVKSEEIAYVETNFFADRAMLVGSDWVKAEREAAKADVVFLLTVNGEGCGISAQILADRDTAFSVVDYMCAIRDFSLAHEFGHLLGLRHHRAADKCDMPFINGHGYVYENEWGTAEAQRKVCDGCPPPPPRQPYWSNPSIKYNGVPMGTEDHENSTEVINETASILAGFGDKPVVLAQLPAGVTHHAVTTYPASTAGTGASAEEQDLLTAGLGKTGLGAASPPQLAYADEMNPTAAELRRDAIHANYRAILDPSSAGGYGRLYGPNIDLTGADRLGEGLVPGKEYSASVDDGSGSKRVAMVVQIPSRFDPANPCIVVGPSSGSRGVYGAIATAGEWGLKKGCAVALTDAGKGMGLYDPADDSVNRFDGTRASRGAAGALAHFAANLSDAARQTFNAAFPYRLALKHVHSQVNPEKDWGQDTLVAVRYALYALNQEYGQQVPSGQHEARFTPGNTLVIAGSVSNGGAAVLRAAEQDAEALIDGVVANEPSAQPQATPGFGVQFGGNAVPTVGKPLIDYITIANLYQPCAALAPAASMSEDSFYNYMVKTAMTARAANRCNALAARGLVAGSSTAEQAADALAKLRAYGWSAEHDTMHNAHYGLGNAPVVGMMYTNAFGRFSVADNLCGMSLAVVNATGDTMPTSAAAKASSFATGNGTANGVPTGVSASVVYNDSVGGAKSWAFAVSPTSGQADFALDVALCQRALVTGQDPVTGAALTATSTPTLAQSQAVRAGMAEVLLNGNLCGTPTLIVAGRSDALVPVNNSSRAYAAYNQAVEGKASELRYIEVTNAQHFDTFLPLPGFDTRFVPLHGYFFEAMNAMYARLKDGIALPPSQVVRTTPRGGTPGAAPALQAAQVPSMKAAPAAADTIDFSGTTIRVPQ